MTDHKTVLTKRQKTIIRMATRKCGLSYRAACARGIGYTAETALQLKRQGYLRLSDNGKDKGRFVFWATEKGKEAINAIP